MAAYNDYYPPEHHSPHVASKNHFDPYPGVQHQPHSLSAHPHPSHSHHSSPLLSQHASPHLGHHMPPRSYPTLEMSAYPDGEGGHVDRPSLGSPMLEQTGPPSRGATPVGGYYTTTMGPHDRALQRTGSVEPSYAHSAPHFQHSSPHLRTPDHSHRVIHNVAPYGPTLKIVQWTPQAGEEGSQVTIILDALAITAAPPTQYSVPAFGPGSPSLSKLGSHTKTAVTRRFVVVFGAAPAPTKFTRAQAIDGNGVGESMDAGPDERDAFVVLTCFVPARQSMGPLDERVMVIVRVVDEQSEVLEEAIVGEWDAMPLPPITPPRYGAMKRPGEELISDRYPPALRSPHLPRKGRSDYLSPAGVNLLVSPRQGGGRSEAPADDYERSAPIHHQADEPWAAPQPELIRSSQISTTGSGNTTTYSNKAMLKLQGDLNTMAMGWSNEEWTNRRRLIQFWRQQDGHIINATFRPISQAEFVPNSIVISCIFRDEWNECFVTSVDAIYLLEALVGVRFTVEEKNRIRRNLEGFKPQTVSKSKPEAEPFFKLIMGFPNPKPRNIEKDVKVFPWKILANALKKIISKYSAAYSGPAPVSPLMPAPPMDGDMNGGGDPRHLEPLAPIAFAPHSPHLVSPHLGHSSQMASPHLGGPSSAINSPHLGGGHFDGPPAGSPALAGRGPLPHPNGHSHSLPPSPHVPQSPSMSQHGQHQSNGPSDRQSPASQPGRPGSFDFGNMLKSSNFANGATNGDQQGEDDSAQQGQPSGRRASKRGKGNSKSKKSAAAAASSEETADAPATAAEGDNSQVDQLADESPTGPDADAEAMPPPPLHSRAFSNSNSDNTLPRRASTSGPGTFTATSASPFGSWTPAITVSNAGGSSSGVQQEYYAQDLAGVSGWGVPTPLPFSSAEGGPMIGGPMLRRSSSLEGLSQLQESGALGWER